MRRGIFQEKWGRKFWADNPAHVRCAHLLPHLRVITALPHKHYTHYAKLFGFLCLPCVTKRRTFCHLSVSYASSCEMEAASPGIVCGWQVLLWTIGLLRWRALPGFDGSLFSRLHLISFRTLTSSLSPQNLRNPCACPLISNYPPHPPFQKTRPFSPFI